ncbi:nitroreductase/quinone reductase family protein [Streptomyces sp. RTd22]|uniref:nitroreductase/quinone reductase family protein n=1 Tax=Streptomyces sp. RTd22 TaxID=1841249 RepID=UPI0007C4FC44|nr:nitroreductase/quinone reductase family protein [Streptomyces sp. RTd22]
MARTRWHPPERFFNAANRLVRPLLRSRLHPLVSRRLMLLTYEGAKSGRTFAIPVAYYRPAPDEVWAFGARTGWMTNFRNRRTVRLRLRGREVRAEATAVEDREQVARLLEELVQRKGPGAIRDPFVGFPRDRHPTHEEALAAADRVRIARFHLSAKR